MLADAEPIMAAVVISRDPVGSYNDEACIAICGRLNKYKISYLFSIFLVNTVCPAVDKNTPRNKNITSKGI